MPAGAPRKVSFSKKEMIALGEEMIAWVEVNNPLHLSEWYTIEKMFLYREWKTFIQRPEFVPYYERALKMVGRQYLDKESRIREGISQRWQRVYFADLKEQEDQDADADAKRREKESALPADVLANQQAMMAMIKDMQSRQSGALNNSDMSSKADNRSA